MSKKTLSANTVTSLFEEWDMLNSLFIESPAVPLKTKEQVVSSAEDYLARGEKLISLAKEKFEEAVKNYSFTSFEECLYSLKYEKGRLLDCVTNKVVRPILRKTNVVKGEDRSVSFDSATCTILNEMLDFIAFDVTLEPLSRCDYSYCFTSILAKGDDSMLHLCIKEDGYPDMDVYGLKNHAHPNSWKNKLFRSGAAVADIARILAWLIMASVYVKAMSDASSDSFKDAQTDYCGSSYRGTKFYHSQHIVGSNVLRNMVTDDEQVMDIWNHPWILPNDSEVEEAYALVEPYLRKKGVMVVRDKCSRYEAETMVSTMVKSGGYKSVKEVPIVINKSMAKDLWLRDSFDFMACAKESFRYHFLLTKGTSNYWALPSNWSDSGAVIEAVFKAQYEFKQTQVATLTHLRELHSSYSKSYQTKKNIPKKTLTAMEESFFNEYFGYVEFDEDVDLAKAQVITEQFVAFRETYFPQIDSKENAIRFRKLGNHKALGLYYPSVKCLCVDINSPQSLVHEYGHLIDYCYGRLSDQPEFYNIKREYEKRIRKELSGDSDLEKRFNKGKYNLKYYLTPTEIYARCFELYVKEILEVNNSLTPNAYNEVVYPRDEQFLDMVSTYFKENLPSVATEEDSVVATDEKAANK